jgi:hypothetical protein
LCSIARLESWVNTNVGKMTIIRPQTSLRHANKKDSSYSVQAAGARITYKILGS